MPKRRPKIPADTAIGYTRVSLNEQAMHGLSLSAQAVEIKDYCARRGLRLLDVASDAGVSGWKQLRRRPFGRRVVALARDGAVGHVVATRLDRLFRNAPDCLNQMQDWLKRGVALHIVDFGGDAFSSTSAMGQFFLQVMAAIAQMERSIIAERVQGVIKYKRARGEWLGSTPYGWLRTPDDHVVKDEFQQSVIRWMLEAVKMGLSFREIVERLNTKKTPAPRGKVWHLTSVKRIVAAAERRTKKED